MNPSKSKRCIVIFLIIACCCSFSFMNAINGKSTLQNEAIQIAVKDFMKTCRLRKKDKVFSVNARIDNDDILGISILGTDENKLYANPYNKIGYKSKGFPTNYIEQEGKLFYWDDTTQVISNEVASALSRYNHIDSTYIDGFNGEIPPYVIDDTKKAAHYYFCKKNLLKYKKVVTNIAMVCYEPPKLKCNN